jgi:ATP-dependent DNA ligase
MMKRVAHTQDISLGKPAKAQLARKVTSPEQAFETMKGKTFVVETKFDGAPCSCSTHAPASSSLCPV